MDAEIIDLEQERMKRQQPKPCDKALACHCGSVRFHYRFDRHLECANCGDARPISSIEITAENSK